MPAPDLLVLGLEGFHLGLEAALELLRSGPEFVLFLLASSAENLLGLGSRALARAAISASRSASAAISF